MDRVYTYPSVFRRAGGTIIALSLLAWLITIIAVFTGEKPDTTLFMYITLFALVFSAFGLFAIRFGSVKVILGQDGVAVKRGSKLRFVCYNAVRGISYTSKWYEAVVLDTDDGPFVIRRDLVGYPEFIETLRQRTNIKDEETGTLRVKYKAWELYISCGIFIALLLGFLILMIIGAATGEIGLGSFIVYASIVLLFIASLLFPALYCPRRYDFLPDAIVKTSLMGAKRFDPSGIMKVEYGQQVRKSYSRYGSRISHFIEIQFKNKKYVRIDQSAIDYPLENIAAYVKKTYDVQDRFFEESLENKTDRNE